MHKILIKKFSNSFLKYSEKRKHTILRWAQAMNCHYEIITVKEPKNELTIKKETDVPESSTTGIYRFCFGTSTWLLYSVRRHPILEPSVISWVMHHPASIREWRRWCFRGLSVRLCVSIQLMGEPSLKRTWSTQQREESFCICMGAQDCSRQCSKRWKICWKQSHLC